MATLETRIAKLEDAVPEHPAFDEFVRRLPPVDAAGAFDWHACPDFAATFGPWLAELGSEQWDDQLTNPIERGVADTLFLFEDSADPFAFERYRGRVPDRILAALYGRMRNYAFRPEVAARVRLLAGNAA